MSDARFDVLTIGNAIVDIISSTEDDFLINEKIIKGAMNLIDAERAEHLYSVMGPAIEASGGSAGNTAVGVASLGGNAAYIGKICDDPLGKIFTHDIRASGVAYDTKPLENEPPTARSFIFVTPDSERSMNTYLGACMELGPDDVEEDKIAQSKITYFEGYLWDPPRAKDAIRQAADIAHANGRQAAITLSDPFCVDRFRREFLELMRSGTVDIIFANEMEILSLYETSSLQSAIDAVRNDCALAAVTRSEHGSLAITRENTVEVEAHPIDKLVDTTGAGDLYASGFLYGLTHDFELIDCARLGGLAAAEVIQHVGPRPQMSLKQLMSQEGY
ncbi:MAG: adenosine kinase [Hyphomicrobiales bacterium]|nr:adenosine kinase [Hyphomicrobiales bacterium]